MTLFRSCSAKAVLYRFLNNSAPLGVSCSARMCILVFERTSPRIISKKPVEESLRIRPDRSEEHTSELQYLMRTSYAVFCLKKKNKDERHILSTHSVTKKI